MLEPNDSSSFNQQSHKHWNVPGLMPCQLALTCHKGAANGPENEIYSMKFKT